MSEKKTIVMPEMKVIKCHLDTPWRYKTESKPRYSVLLNASKASAEMVKALDEIRMFAENYWGAGTLESQNIPLKDGDVLRAKNIRLNPGKSFSYLAGIYQLSAGTGEAKPPQLYKVPRIEGRFMPAVPADFYPGCYVVAEITLDIVKTGNQGVCAYLQRIAKTRDGERIGDSGGIPMAEWKIPEVTPEFGEDW